MIVGIGIDLIEIDRIKQAVDKHKHFPNRILTREEFDLYHSYKGQRQMEFLAGRFSAKEAFSKAMGTGIGKSVNFQNISILNNQRGQPQVVASPFDGIVHISISHTHHYAMAQVLLES